AHARIQNIDVSEAKNHPGVIAIYTANDLGDYWKPGPLLVSPPPIKNVVFHERTQVPLAKKKVRHAGEAIAIVAAESRYIAEDAVEKIVMEMEP
ncbi:MAG: xanthine dehydrogenase family protein molybdopterin-binding subunit, partial [Calditrichae bacterium]|nr:xanthine dehydrogenase family protein molybdopterin-binding subunit [Calditrichia bacterium]NIW80200.1 xanthine dehydrogenase family protein molybdopterin-binding subunit [Calditrichia bacterium]